MSSLVGKRLQGGKYKLESVLGRGGFGLTFRAYQTYLEQAVVIKTLNESFWAAPNLKELQRQFQDEGRRLALCRHPNVVRVTDFFVEDYLPYVVMDYIPGRSLYDIVFDGQNGPRPLSESVAVRYIQQIGGALQAVHSKGLLHRDVKPQNIMVHDLTGEAILIDFGIARELTPNSAKTHTSIVSEGYAPIEQYLPKAHRSAATDVYGLAATLYLLLTGEVPVAAVLRDRTPMIPVQQLRPDVSGSVVDAIAQGMQIELRDRPQSVARWLSLLTGLSGRSQAHGADSIANGQFLASPSPSQLPTRVVAPAYQPSSPAGYQAGQGASADTSAKTVAVPKLETAGTVVAPGNQPLNPPDGQFGYGTVQEKTQKKGSGCGLLLFSLLLAGLAAAGGFWVVQQLVGRDVGSPSGDPTEIETSDPVLEEPVEVIPDEDEEASEDELEELNPEETEAEEGAVEADVTGEDASSPDGSQESTDNGVQTPPLLLDDSGNPDNAQPGGAGAIVPIPGLPPGSSESRVRGRLGSPNRSATINGFPTSVYNLMPNRVRLAYVFDPDSKRVQQSEATFSPAVEHYQIQATLLSTLRGKTTVEIERGLNAVIDRERDRYDIRTNRFSGAIVRNRYGHIHIYVRD
ncbi:MAG: serine/threonine-protein kinase [Cyanobacteria bacterium P01_D01_bin.1]